MTLQQLEQNAEAFFASGYNCAESVSQAVIEMFNAELPAALPRIASALGGGIGGTHQELCGAFTGGILAIGYLLGRSQLGEDNSLAKEAAAEFRTRLLDNYGMLNCGVLLEKFGDQVDDQECRKIVGKAAGELGRLLNDKGLRFK